MNAEQIELARSWDGPQDETYFTRLRSLASEPIDITPDEPEDWPEATTIAHPARASLANVRDIEQPSEPDGWLFEGLLRPGRLLLLASREGVGKSYMRKEAEIRAATGRGPLFGYFEVARPLTVATFEEENGPDEEWRRDEHVLRALAVTRAELGDRMHRISHGGLDLTDLGDQRFIRSEIERVGANVAFFDTGGAMMPDEWGTPMKVAMRFLHSLPCAPVVTVHLTKPTRDGRAKAGPATSAVITDVMGQWTRSADVVALVTDLGAGRVRMQIRKRAPHVDLTLYQAAGLWAVASVEEGEIEPGADLRVMRAIHAGVTSAGDLEPAVGLSKRQVYRVVADLRGQGFMDPNRYRLTPSGVEAIG